MEPRVVSVDQVDPAQMKEFLQQAYGPAKATFLQRHGAWWYRGDENRWVVVADEQVAGYCAIIPTTCSLQGHSEPALWWVDLVVAQAFRGQGIQRLLDQKVRARVDLKLGFPNELAARIHRKHGWGVRDDLAVLMLPLRPRRVKQVHSALGRRGVLLRAGAATLEPLAASWRWRLRRHTPQAARRLADPSPEVLAGVFARHQTPEVATTYRDAMFIQWRYLDAPYRSDLVFYLAGPLDTPTHYLVARHVVEPGGRATRILDVFGDFEDRAALRDLVLLATRDALLAGSAQVTVLISLPALRALFHRLGFVIGAGTRFCWYSTSMRDMDALGRACHWTLADSDNDAVVHEESL